MAIFCLSIFVFSNCNQQFEKQQLSDNQLVVLILDTQILEAASSHLTGTVKDSLNKMFYDVILKKHNLDKMSFEKTIDKLSANPERAKKIYNMTSDSIQSRINSLNSLQ